MPGPIIRDPFTGPAVPQFARDARAWVDEPTPAGWWTTPQDAPGADMLTQVIKALVRATGVTDPAAQPMMMAATGVPRVAQPIKAAPQFHGAETLARLRDELVAARQRMSQIADEIDAGHRADNMSHAFGGRSSDHVSVGALHGNPRYSQARDAKLSLERRIQQLEREERAAIKAAKKSSRGDAVAAAKPPIRAYHGSPHDFDKFSTAKIGTGEGAQAYGHGLYFAENPATAAQYKNNLGKVVPAFDGQPVTTAAESMAHDIISRIPRSANDQANLQRALDTVDQWADAGVFRGQNEGKAALDVKRAIEANFGKKLDKTIQGKTYEVAIHADPDQMLDWDKPLSELPGQIQKTLRETIQANRPEKYPSQYAETNILMRKLEDGTITGGEAYQLASKALGKPSPMLSSVKLPDRVQASEALKKAGIPGIKYLDQGSRSAGEGTRNYVVFDDSLIEILKKYGFLPPLAATGGADKQPVLRSEGRANAGLQRGRILNIKPVASH